MRTFKNAWSSKAATKVRIKDCGLCMAIKEVTDGQADKATMRDFDARHLVVPTEIEPSKIKRLREANNVS